MWNTLSTTYPLFVFGHCLWSNGLSIVYFSSSYTCSENRRIVLNTIATLLYTSCDVEYLVQSSRPLFLLAHPELLLLLPLFKKPQWIFITIEIIILHHVMWNTLTRVLTVFSFWLILNFASFYTCSQNYMLLFVTIQFICTDWPWRPAFSNAGGTSHSREEEVEGGGGGRWSSGTLSRWKSLSSDDEDEEDDEFEVSFFPAP